MYGYCDFPGCRDLSTCRPVITVSSERMPEGARQDGFLANVAGEDRYVHQLEVLAELCSYHQGTFNLKDYLTDEAWGAIDNHAVQLGFAKPNRDRVKVEWRQAAGPDGLDDEGRELRDAMHGLEHTTERREKLLQSAYAKGAEQKKILEG